MTLLVRVRLCLYTLSFILVLAVPNMQAQTSVLDTFEILVKGGDRFPSPGETVRLYISGNTERPESIRTVTWRFNGEEAPEFQNKSIVSYTAGSIGAVVQVEAEIVYFDFLGERRKTFARLWLTPAIFDIVWEGDVVVPPGYRGYPLVGPQTPVRLWAFIRYRDPEGTLYTENDFSFRWDIEASPHPDNGPGAHTIVFEEGIGYIQSPVYVGVKATQANNVDVILSEETNIHLTKPRLLVYEHNFLYGLLSNLTIPKSASTSRNLVMLSVYPLFFSKDLFTDDKVSYFWFLNGASVPQKRGRKIDVSFTSGGSGVRLRLLATNKNEKKYLQRVEQGFSLRF